MSLGVWSMSLSFKRHGITYLVICRTVVFGGVEYGGCAGAAGLGSPYVMGEA